MAIFLIAIGLLFTGIDFHLGIGIAYPEFVKPQGEFLGTTVKEGIQNYVTQNILGDTLRADPLPDVIGCILIIIGVAMLMKHNKRYISSIVLAVISGTLSVLVRVVPFFINSAALVVVTLLLFFLSFVFEIWMEYKVIYTTVGISDDVVNYGTNRRMQFLWWVSVFARVFIFNLTVTGLTTVRHWYDAATILFTILYLYQLLQTRKYVGTFKVYKEGFDSAVLPDYIREKIDGVSFHENRDISMDELRYTRVLHYGFDGQVKEGELIVHRSIAYQTMRVFYQLYKIEYPIEKIRLVDDYNGDDNLSMADNNSSAFNYRKVQGKDELSKHALGLAIDINPRVNPYVTEEGFYPENGAEYLERDPVQCTGDHRDKMIHKNDMVYKIFKRNGFRWGGEWEHAKDYQHFYVEKRK